MVTMLSGGKGQVVVKGTGVTGEWEARVRAAAARHGQQFSEAIVSVMDAWAVAVLKRDEQAQAQAAEAPVVNLPVRLEDIATTIEQGFARMRRGRWRR